MRTFSILKTARASFARESIHDSGSLYDLMTQSAFLDDFRKTAAQATRGCIVLERPDLVRELAEKLRKLEESAQKLSAEDAQKALGDLAQQQQRLREQLEKSVEMLKRAALEGTMQTLKDEAKDIAEQERAVAESLAAKRGEQENARELADLGRHFGAGLYEAEVRYLVETEFARTAEDIVWRRTKLGLEMSEAEQGALAEWLGTTARASR